MKHSRSAKPRPIGDSRKPNKNNVLAGAGSAAERECWPAIRTLSAACALMCGAAVLAQENTSTLKTAPLQIAQLQYAQFDPEILRQRGLSPSTGDYFRTPRGFNVGEQPVAVTVNGNLLGRKQARFNLEGQLCFTPVFVQMIGLIPMDGAGAAQPGVKAMNSATPIVTDCPDYRSFAPRALVTLQATMSAVDITLPGDYVQVIPRAQRTESGGVGALLNYRAYATNFTASDASVGGYRYRYFDTTVGINIDNWIFRSSQDFSNSNGQEQSIWRSAYGQKTFEAQKQVLQFGRITIQDPLFGGLPIVGAQWIPERALYTQGAIYPINGVAATRARVEIRQNGVILLNTVVPPGPFSLTEYPLQNRGADLEVRVIEETGATQVFTVPALSLLMASSNTQFDGWNLSGGTVWDQSKRHLLREAPVVVASHGWVQGRFSGTLGGQLSSRYFSAGGAGQASFLEQNSQVFGQILAAHDGDKGTSGAIGSLSGSNAITNDIKIGASASLRSAKFRSLQETLAYQQTVAWVPAGYRSQLGTTLGWNTASIGTFSIGLAQENYFFGAPGRTTNLNWSKTWGGGVNLSVGLAHRGARLSPADRLDIAAGNTKLAASNYAYLSMVVPLGADITSRSFAQRTDRTDRIGTTIDQRINPYFGYRASAEQLDDGNEKSRGTSLSVYGTPYYSSLGAGISRLRNFDSSYAEASGGVVATRDGIAFSPQAVQDSFGTLRTGNVVGARIDTPQGEVRSGPGGLAALPGLSPYRDSRLEIGGTSVPLDMEISNGLQVVEASRGAVLLLTMDMQRVRRILLLVSLEDGSPLSAGSAILRGGNDFFGASSEGGRVMVSDLKPGDTLYAELGDGKRCTIEKITPLIKADGEMFEKATATCRL